MNQQQQDAVNAAQKKYFDALTAANIAQSTWAAQAEDLQTSKFYAIGGVIRENAQRKAAAEGVYMAKLNAAPGLQQVAIDAWALVGSTHTAYLDAVNATLTTPGVEEWIPPNIQTPGTGGGK